jgi:hypothetical protein
VWQPVQTITLLRRDVLPFLGVRLEGRERVFQEDLPEQVPLALRHFALHRLE